VHGLARERLHALLDLGLGCVEREYPNHVSLWLRSDADLAPPRELTPSFYGCLDWHSAVHSHWLLARGARLAPQEERAERACALLGRHLSPERLLRERRFLEPRPGFERPYGLGWLLRLHQELSEWDRARAAGWAAALEPLAELCAERLCRWLERLTHPIRSGVHSQSALAMSFALDWARALGRADCEAVLSERAQFFHAADRDAALQLEPSGEDFLSPSLGAADLMRRVLGPQPFAAWLSRALPALGRAGSEPLRPVAPLDRSDGRLAHLDGLNLSRAWMLAAVARALPSGDLRCDPLEHSAREHARAGLAAVDPGEYMGAHWLGSFALYLESEIGVR